MSTAINRLEITGSMETFSRERTDKEEDKKIKFFEQVGRIDHFARLELMIVNPDALFFFRYDSKDC